MSFFLDENNRIQAEGGAKSLSFGRPTMQIPIEDYYELIKRYPALESRDRKEKLRAWQKIARDPDYRKFRVGKF